MSELLCSKASEIGMITQKIKDIEMQLMRDEKAHDRIQDDITELSKVYNVIHELSTNIALIATETKSTKEVVKDIKTDVKTLSDDIDEIRMAPTEELKYYKRALIATVLTAIVGAFLAGTLIIP